MPESAPAWLDLLVRVGLPSLLFGGLGGAIVSAILTARREQAQRRYAYAEQQLRDLYSPLLALRSEIRMRSELRLKVSQVMTEEWQRLLDAANVQGAEAVEALLQRRGDDFMQDIDYDNKQFREELFPAYQEMVKVFRSNLWLAEPETRTHFRALIEYVELWRRHLDKVMPPEVGRRIHADEATLRPFYEHLEKKHEELRTRLAKGEV